ncbi:centromere protein J isoform X2 [Hippocampus zosterae]|uniref:centromere protein J isoform X2 n=1 Tax=Hippocampus zosterae TaxID=109293 RepID=UPI00223D50F5|nr:centromere protein J isoform X2 [Hippocampus zosterae]
MSSPLAGLPHSSSDFLARWMPSSTRAGVILDPGCLRYDSTGAAVTSEPEDFAPIATSVDSSCLDVESLSGAPGRYSEAGRLEETPNSSQEVSITMKLDQLRRWQQHLQEQLKVDQLDQLLCLQEKQQQQQQRAAGASSPGHNHSSHPEGAQKHRHQEEEALTRLENCQNSTERHDEEDGPKHDGFPTPRANTNNHNTHDNKRKDNRMIRDRPIQAGKQTFEEMLEEQLRLEEHRLKSAQQQQNPDGGQSAPPPKRAFLRRGEGLSRFTRKSSLPKEDLNADLKPSSQATVVTRTTSEKGVEQRLPVQRKTATMNKENRPRDERDRRDVRVEMKATRTKVLGCHQRQNTGGEVRTNRQVEESKTATKQADARAVLPNVLQESLETSLVEKLRRWECERHLESMELGEFELLEQAADELSFSSNSSFVSKILQMDREKQKLLGVAGLHQRRLSSTPIKLPPAREQQRSPEIISGAVKGHDEEEESSSEAHDNVKETERIVDPPGFLSSVCYPVPSEPPYDKRSYQDDNGESEDVVSSIGDDEDDDSSTLEDDKDATPGQVVFDDDTTWNETDDTAVSIEPVDAEAANQASDVAPTLPPPPNSKLMMKLFPALKPKTQNAPLPPPDITSTSPPDKTDNKPEQQVQSTQLRERLVELEIEIERFKKENAALAKLRQENEQNQENLRKERLAWEQERAEQLARFEEYKREETAKLQRERKVFEKHASAARAVPDKKEREEIQQQLSSLQEDLKKKESRWSATHGRLRQQIDSLGQENSELRDEVRMLEKLRLSALKNSVVTEKDVRHGPSVSKGVTFASPLDSRSVSPPRGSAAAPPRGNSTAQASKGTKSSLKKTTESSSSSSPREVSEEKQMAAKENSPNEQDSDSYSPLVWESNEADRSETTSLQEVITHPDGKVETVLAGGDRVIVYPNGTTKQVSCDGTTVTVNFFNGDTKEVTADHRVLYYYADTKTTHITYPDGMEVLHFPNNQIEKHFPDGRKEITFADQTVKTLFPDGSEESVMTDGTVVQIKTDGTKEIHFNTGQKEVHTADYKRREYPDGTVKTVYTDGRQETRYPGGRLRVKDKYGNVLTDERQ